MTAGQAYYVYALARGIGPESPLALLAECVRSLALAQACLTDLQQASDCCDTLAHLRLSHRGAGTTRRPTTEAALLAHGISLYARATSTSAKDGARASIDIRSSLTASEKADHVVLLEVRNKGLAHVYPDRRIAEDVWSASILGGVETGEGIRLFAASRNTQVSGATITRLNRMLPVAIRIVSEKTTKRMAAVEARLKEHRLPYDTWDAYPLDLTATFGSERAVQAVLASAIPGGSLKLFTGQ